MSGEDRAMCAGCEEKLAVDSGLCDECADWCADFFSKLFPEASDA